MALEQIGLAAVLQDQNFQAGLKRYTAGIGQMTKITDGAAQAIGGAFKVATGALLIGAGAIGGILATSVKAAADAEQIAAQTDAVLQSTKGVAGMTREAVGDLATALSELTPFEDDAIQGGENLLLTFTNIGKNVFPLATETMLDMSQAMGQDLKSSAIQLGKALNSPAEGLSALQRVGVQFTKQQEAQVKALVAAGKTEEAQRVILKELQTEFGGAAKAAGKTFAGQLQILKNTLGNVQEEIGGALLPVLTKLAGAFVKVLADPKVKAGIKAITQGIEDLVDIFSDLIAGRNYNALFRFYYLMERVFGKEIAQKIYGVMSAIGRFRDYLVDAWEAVRQAFEFGGVHNAIAVFVANLAIDLGASQETVAKLFDIAIGITTALLRIKNAFDTGGIGGAFSQIAKEVQAAWPAISTELSKWGAQFWDWLTGPQGAIQQAGDKLGLLAGTLARVLTEKWNTLISPTFAGWAVMFWDWLTGPQGAIAKVGEAIGTLLDAAKEWVVNGEGKGRITSFGESVGYAIGDAIRGFFEKDETKKKSTAEALGGWLGRVLGDVGSIAWGAVKSFGAGLGVDLGDWVVQSILRKPALTPEQRKQVTDYATSQKSDIEKIWDGVMLLGKLKVPTPVEVTDYFKGLSVSANQTITELQKNLQGLADLLPHSLAKTGPLSVEPNYTALFDPLITAAITAQTSLDKILQGIADDFKLYLNRWLDSINVFIGNWWMTWNNGLSYVQTQTVNAFNNLFNYLISLEPIFYSYGLTLGNQLAAGLAASYANIQSVVNGLSNIGPPPQRPSIGYASGGWVNRTGMALVHRGEYVIPARQTSNISNNNSRSVGTVTVNINGSTGMGASEIKKAVYAGIREVLEAA